MSEPLTIDQVIQSYEDKQRKQRDFVKFQEQAISLICYTWEGMAQEFIQKGVDAQVSPGHQKVCLHLTRPNRSEPFGNIQITILNQNVAFSSFYHPSGVGPEKLSNIKMEDLTAELICERTLKLYQDLLINSSLSD